MEYVVLYNVYVFSGNDVDLAIPIMIQSIELLKLRSLFCRQRWEILKYNIYSIHVGEVTPKPRLTKGLRDVWA